MSIASSMHRAVAFGIAMAIAAGCGGAELPRPALASPPASAFEEVPYPPPVVRPEAVPPQPARDAVWIDGQWIWSGRAWRWEWGAWVLPPKGARYTPWRLGWSRDGRVLVAPGAFRVRGGREVAPRVLVRARTPGSVGRESE